MIQLMTGPRTVVTRIEERFLANINSVFCRVLTNYIYLWERMKLWVRRHKIEQHPNVKGLVFSVARNYCVDVLRKKRREIQDTSLHHGILKSDCEQEPLEWKELNLLIRRILKNLPERQREVLMMRDLDGYEFTEIAAATKLKVEHVRVLLSRARKQVSIQLEKIYSYEGK